MNDKREPSPETPPPSNESTLIRDFLGRDTIQAGDSNKLMMRFSDGNLTFSDFIAIENAVANMLQNDANAGSSEYRMVQREFSAMDNYVRGIRAGMRHAARKLLDSEELKG